MNKLKLEYIWLDGYTPEPNVRTKTRVIDGTSFNGMIDQVPEWSFDGSSTLQADGTSSDCILKPVQLYPDPFRENGYLVLCEVYDADNTPHISNLRALFPDDPDLWLGFEQEYVIMKNGKPLGFPEEGYPEPQGKYYCAVGDDVVKGREFVEEHLDLCLQAGLDITGVNAEVMVGQWEFQLLGKGAKKAADDLAIARYILARLSEKYRISIEFHPKPIKGDWNGSGMHTNFSTRLMRELGGKEYFDRICETLGRNHQDHIKEYGAHNHERLTGLHETQRIDQFSFGASDRGSSIRIPLAVIRNDWKGYLEDRRPASNADPYRVAAKLIESLSEVNHSNAASA